MNDNREQNIIYLDNNATTPPLLESIEAMDEVNRFYYGNASSYHKIGAAARFELEKARASAAGLIGARPSEIIFTSSGTEANNLAILGLYRYLKNMAGLKKCNIVTSPFEHHSVLNALKALAVEGVEIRTIAASGGCGVDCGALESLIDGGTILVSVMYANNETGSIFPVEKIAAACRAKNVIFHVDAVCATGKIPYKVHELGCDMLSFSSHKIYGPKGAGALYKKRGVELMPQLLGGGQEAELRAGTENLSSIAGFAAACDYFTKNIDTVLIHYKKLKSLFVDMVRREIPGIRINCSDGPETLPNTVSVTFSFEDVHEAGAFMFNLDMAGVCVSLGAACASMAKEPSHVLLAMGMSELEAQSTVRVSMGLKNTVEDIIEAVFLMKKSYDKVISFRKKVRASNER